MEKKEHDFYERMEAKGVSRRDFMKYCTFLTAAMGLSASFVPKGSHGFCGTGPASAGGLAPFRGMHGMHRRLFKIHVSLD